MNNMRNSNIIYFEETNNFNQIVEDIAEVIQTQNTNNIHHATMRFKNLQEEFVNLLYTQFITGKYEAKVMSVNNKEDVYTYFDIDWQKALSEMGVQT